MVMRRSTVWVDSAAQTRVHLLTTTAGASTVEAALAAKSNAAVQLSWEGDLVVVSSPTPVLANYQSVRDAAELLYETSAGVLQKVLLPAPQAGIFMGDGETVNPAQITAITAAILANVVTTDGTALTAYRGGHRSRSK